MGSRPKRQRTSLLSCSVSSSDKIPRAQPNPGLCADCLQARRIESDRGSVFFLCQLSLTDDRFPKYPRLPVLACSGYHKKSAERE